MQIGGRIGECVVQIAAAPANWRVGGKSTDDEGSENERRLVISNFLVALLIGEDGV